jgi:hypothetical protein
LRVAKAENSQAPAFDSPPSMKKDSGKEGFPESFCFRLKLEFVAQSKLHEARVGNQAGVVAESLPLTVEERAGRVGCGSGLNVEANGVGNVENLPTELPALSFGPPQGPTFLANNRLYQVFRFHIAAGWRHNQLAREAMSREMAQRRKSSSWMRVSVLASRYLTMTAHCSDRPHFAPAG